MTHSAKHFDPQLGLDIHTYMITPITPPVPLPSLNIGMVLDPFDYIPVIGCNVHVNGIKAAGAGAGGIDIHIFLGLPVPPPAIVNGPQFMGEEIFMGSQTVSASGAPFARIGMPVLDCNLFGLVNPFRPSKPSIPQLSMSLPTGLNIAIPNTVYVGGPPTINWMALAFKAGFAALGKGLGALRRSQRFQRGMDKFRDFRVSRCANMPPGFLKCKVLRAEPVDIRRGSVEVAHQDFSIPGRLPLAWTRRYRSDDLVAGSCGAGWRTPADTRLEIEADGTVVFWPADGALAVFPQLPGAGEGVPELVDGAVLTRRSTPHASELHVRTKDDLVYVFDAPASNVKPLSGVQTLPILRIEDLHGNHWRFERVDGRLVRITESGVNGLQGRFLEVDDRGGLLHRILLHDPATGASHPLVRYRYDNKDLIAAHDALDAARTFEYREHRMVRHTDRTGLNFYYAYDAQHRVVHAWGDGGLYDYRFAYNELIKETEVTDSLGNVSLVKFDGNDLPLCEIDPLGGCTFFEYDELGRTSAVTDAMGLRTEFEHDERGNLVELKRPDDSKIATAYDADNKATAITDPSGGQWQQQWNDKGLLIAQTTPLNAKSSYDYDAQGQLVRHTNPRGAATLLAFDRHGQLSKLTNALGHATHFEHDALGRLLRRTDPAGRSTEYRYDAKGRLLKATLPGGASVSCEYDAEDQLTRYVDENGAVTELKYFGIGQIAERHQPDGHKVKYLYDSEEQLTGVVNQRGETYHLKRDALGRIVEEIDYWGQGRRYDYDAAGRITRSTDPLGRAICFATDPLGRITQKTLPDWADPTKQVSESFKYNKAGQLIELKNAHSHVKRQFDADGRLIEEQQNGFKIENQFDALGNRILRKTSAGNTVAVEFDLLDQPLKIAINDEAPITIERNALGQATVEKLSPHMTRTLKYNDQGLLTSQAVLKDGAPLFDTRFDYDKSGNLTKRADSEHGSDTYTYDPMGRILAHTDPTGQIKQYLNDPAGDRLKTRINEVEMKQAVGGHLQPTMWSREGEYDGLHYSFDRAGNLTSRRHMNEPQQPTLRLEWDANQRLAKSYWDRGERHGQVTTYGYDPLGRRVFKKNPTHTTYFFWDGDALLGEVEQDNAPELQPNVVKVVDFIAARQRAQALQALMPKAREYVYRPGSFEPLALVDRHAEVHAVVDAAPVVAISTKPLLPPSNPPTDNVNAGLGALGDGLGLGVEPAVPETQREGLTSLPAELGRGALGRLGLGLSLGGTAEQPADLSDSPSAPSSAISPPIVSTTVAKSPSGTAGVPQSTGVFQYHNDLNGCPARLTTPGGQVVWSATHPVWGQAARLCAHLVDQSIRLQGQYEDFETGLIYNRHRYYESSTGLFISKDPVGLFGGVNIYAFGRNTVRYTDPLGLNSTALDKALGGVVGDGYQAHHLIPEEVMSDPAYRTMFDRLRRIGFDPDGAGNGIHLPGSSGLAQQAGVPGHWSSHNQYTSRISQEVDDLFREWSQGLSDTQLALGIKDIQRRAADDIMNRRVAMAGNCRMT